MDSLYIVQIKVLPIETTTYATQVGKGPTSDRRPSASQPPPKVLATLCEHTEVRNYGRLLLMRIRGQHLNIKSPNRHTQTGSVPTPKAAKTSHFAAVYRPLAETAISAPVTAD